MSHTTERRRAPRAAATVSVTQRRDRRHAADLHSDPVGRQRALLVRGTAGMAPAVAAVASLRRAGTPGNGR